MDKCCEKFEKEIRKTEKSMEDTFREIFREIEAGMNGEGRKPKKKTMPAKILRKKLKRSAEEKALKKALAKNWKDVQKMHDQQFQNRRNADRVLWKQSKSIIKKWQSDLIEIKRLADQTEKEAEKLASMIQNAPYTSYQQGSMNRLHHHFINSHEFLDKVHKKKLTQVFQELIDEVDE